MLITQSYGGEKQSNEKKQSEKENPKQGKDSTLEEVRKRQKLSW